ncbi:MAG TPA: cell division protein ZapA [Pseudomonas sp.]|nr:cell division protein ZapA [Pseudomonas sp.]
MNNDNAVTVLNFFGRDYPLKAPSGKQALLEESAALLRTHIADIQQKRPAMRPDELLLLAALSVCSIHLEMREQHRQQLEEVEQRLLATRDRIQLQLDLAAG